MKNSHVLAWSAAAVAALVIVASWWNRDPQRARNSTAKASPPPTQANLAAAPPNPAGSAVRAVANSVKTLPNLDHRAHVPGRGERQAALEKSRAMRRAAADELRAKAPGVRVDFDETLGSPKFIASTKGFLATADDPQQAVKAFIDEHAALFGHGSSVLAEARLARDYETPHNGMHTFVWQQELEGVRVFESTFQAHVTNGGELVNVASRFVPDAAAAAAKPAQIIDVKTAISAAGADVGETVAPAQIAENAPPEGPSRKQRFRSTRLLDVSAEHVWLPEDESALRLCWEVTFVSKARGEMFRSLVDAESGAVLVRQGLTEYITDATYQVFTGDSPSPFSPGHATPLTTQPPLVSRTTVTTPALNTTASLNGWIDDGVNETRGNNVDAHTDTNADNVADTPRPQGSPTRVFAPALDLTQAPSTYSNAAVVDLFYWNNLIHDRYYELGSTEAAGNFQNDNFGRGGNGNDAVQADAQDGSGTDNANFSTPPDGSPGRMQMYVFTGPAPDRDGDFDHEIVTHEYTHGLSNRLVGGGVGISALQPRGMGEGWSDFYALCVLSVPADDPNAVYAAGGYATYQLSGLMQNYYYGIRRYPYCTDLAKNPLTFKDIDPTQASAHTGVPRSPIIGSTANEVHNMGEVWCVALWDARANLIAKLGAAAGNNLILQLVTDGMKLAPANPNFLQARDAIIQADLVDNSGANRDELWSAFAKRGMGANASSPDSSTTVGLVESYDFPDDLAITPGAPFTASGTIGGPFTPGAQTYTLRNDGDAMLAWTAAKSQPWLTLSASAGSLAPGATTQVTATLNAAANELEIGSHADALTFHNNASGADLTRTVSVFVTPPRAVYYPLDSDPGWTRTGEWAFGHPTGGGGTSFGYEDPTSGATGANVLGVNLAGDYSTTVGAAYHVTTAAIDLSGLANTRLQFQRWLNADYQPYVYATIEISTNGTTWTSIWDNGSSEIADSAWTKVSYDISAIADGEATVYIRWGHQVGYSGAYPYSGWNIDDIEILGAPPTNLTVVLPALATEGDAPATGTIAISPAPPTDLVVGLTSSEPGRLTVPATVTIPANATSASFALTVIDDALLNGTVNVAVTPSAAGWAPHSATMAVHDNETAVLTLNLPANTTEGAGSVSGTVTASAAVDANVVVQLTSSAPGEIVPPATVTIPAGQTSATFNPSIVDDTRIDGAVTTTITAQVTNWTTASADITVADNETRTLSVIVPATLREGDGTASASVQIPGTLAAPLTVSLASSDTSELMVPASVTIAAGQTSATFAVTIGDDPDADGAQPAVLTATAATFADGMANVTVADNDAHHFAIAPIASPQVPNAPFAVTVSARDVNDAPITNYNSPVTFSAAGDAGALPLTPGTLTSWVNGAWTSSVTIAAAGTNVMLTASDGQGHTGVGNAFDLATGPVHHFAWSTIASPQTIDNFFPATITAQDAGNNTVTAFGGTTNLSVAIPNGTTADIGAGVTTWDYPMHTANHDARVTSIYLASELGGARRITALALYVTTLPGQTMNAWTIRLKHSSLTAFPGPSWESGFTTVYQASQTITQTGWVTFQFSTPFDYNGTSSLMIDFCHNNASASTSGSVRNTSTSGIRSMYYATNSLYGDPLMWSGGSAPASPGLSIPNVRLSDESAPTLAVANPPVSGSFVNGSWTGNVAVPFTGTGLRLVADDGANHTGQSNAFTAQAPAALPGTSTTVFSEPFEDATLGSWWTITGTNTYRTQLTTTNTPHGGAKHLTMDSSVSSSYSRNEATLTVNLAGRTGVSLSFWAKEFGDEPNGPPTIPFTGGADFDGVAISANGTTWYEVQALRTLTSSYAQLTVNLDAAIATYGLSYNSAFKIRFNQYDDNPIATDGIAIDDILINAAQTPSVTVSVPAQAAENAGALTGTVSFASARVSDTTVALVSNATARVAVPASVTVPAGQSSATFTLSVLDNALLDGNRSVGIIATPPDNIPASASILIVDDDVTTLTLTLPASTTEGATGVTGTATLATAPAGALTFSLASSDTTEVTVPAMITFAAGQTSASFALTIVNDTLIDGTQNVTITASATGWTSASASIAVLDNENTNLTVTLPASAREGDAPAAGSVAISGSLASNLVVTLTSDDTSEVTVPATVTILAGQTSAAFSATIVDDTELDGTQTATITASATGFTTGSRAITIADNDVHHFVLSAVPSPQFRDAAFTLTVTAKDANDLTMTGYTGPASLTAVAGGNSVAVAPATLATFVNGVWTGPVTVTSLASGVVLTVGSAGHIGTSNAFDVIQQDDSYPENWATFGNGPSHSGYQPVALGGGSYQAGWTKNFATGGYALNQVAISNGRIYATPYVYFTDTYLSALDGSTGAELWRKTFVSAYSINPPTVNGAKVYTQRCDNGGDSQLWCLDAISGAATWNAPFGAQWERYFAPTVVNDGVWVDGGSGGGLYGFNTSNGSQRFFNSSLAQYDQWTPAYYLGTIYTWVAGVFRAHDPTAGTILWSFTLSTGVPYSVNTVPAIDAGKAFVVGNPNLYAIDLATHATAWTVSGTFKGSPAVANGTVYVLGGSDVKAYNASTGALVGTYATGSSTIAGQPIVTNDSLIVSSSTNTYLFTLGTFTPRQTLSSGGTASLANGVLYLAGADGVLRTFRPAGMTTITVAVPASASEGSPALTGTVTLAPAAVSSTVVSLTSSDPARVTVPASVTVAAGQTSATFQLTVEDDSLLNGSETVGITAKGPSQLFLAGAAAITVNDNETATLSVSVPASATEGVGSVTGTVTVSAAPAANIAVALASSDTTEATVPASVTVLAGQTTATFPITIVNDTQIDGPQPATITASVPGWVNGSGTITVLDNENTNLSLSTYSVNEGSTGSGTVYISGTLTSALVVSLSSANTARLTVPASVTIPAGSTSVSFTLTGVNNALTDGAATVNVTASASGFMGATSATTVYDNDIHHFSVSSIGTAQIANVPFSVYFYAQSVDGYTISGFNSSATLAVSAGGSSLPATPAAVSFSSGYASTSVSVNATGTGATLQISDGAGHTGTSNSFNVSIGALDHFALSTIASPQIVGTPFAVTVTAKDAYNNTVPSFTSTTALSAGPIATVSGTGSGYYGFVLGYSTQQRDQAIYLASEVGPAGKITSLAFQAYVYSAGTLGNFTIRLKHTALSGYGASPGWDATGWTTVYQGSLAVTSTGTVWLTAPLTTPFQFDGTSNLMVDITHNGSGVDGYSLATSKSSTRTLWYSGSGYADPLTWSGTSNPTPGTSTGLPNLRVQLERAVPLTPATTGNFVNGVWSGNIAINQIASGINVRADNGSGIAGESNVFNVSGAPVLDVSPASGVTATANYGGSATPASAAWTLTNTGTGTMTWSAAKTAPWLTLSATSGTLAAGASTTVTATIATAGVAPGAYADTITFTNANTGVGNTTRSVALTVTLPAPALAAEPPITGGSGNTVSWSAVSGASAYEVQAADNAAFTSAISSGWINATSYTFTPLADGVTWHFRVRTRATVPGATGSWSQTSQAEFATGTATNVSTSASPGRVVLSNGFTSLTENFDEAGTAWSSTIFSNVSGSAVRSDLAGIGPNTSPALPINQGGDLEGRLIGSVDAQMPSVPANLFSDGTIDAYVAPSNRSALQHAGLHLRCTGLPLSLTGYEAIILFYADGSAKADFSKTVNGIGTWFYTSTSTFTVADNENIHMRFSAAGSTLSLTLWRVAVSGGVVTETAIPFFNGTNTLTATDTTYASGYAGLHHWSGGSADMLLEDASVSFATAGFATSGSMVSSAISPSPFVRWSTLGFTKDVSASGTLLGVAVLDASGALLAANVTTGADLNAIPAVAAVSSIRFRANLSTSNTANTPALDDWSIGWKATPDVTADSAWSSEVSSVQDATAPALAATSSSSVSSAAYTLTGVAGDLSGVASVIVNGVAATTSDGLAHWSTPVTLTPGPNAFTIVAQDFAVPANVTTIPFTATYSSPNDTNGNGLPDAWEAESGLNASDLAFGDRDRDGMLNIVEYALGLDPTVPDGPAGCWITTETNPADGLRYLVLHYRHRLSMTDWTIDVETSPDPIHWSAAPSGFEQTQAPTTLPGGAVEVVHVRVLQPMAGAARAFVRLHVRPL